MRTSSKRQKSMKQSAHVAKSVTRIFYYSVLLICLGVLLQKYYSFSQRYMSHPTVTSVSFKVDSDLQFPAFTLCHDLIKSEAQTNPKVPVTARDPRPVYKEFPFENMTVGEFYWKYSFSAKDMIKRCKIGVHSCIVEDEVTPKDPDDSVLITEVEAGKWLSKFHINSGLHAICHTLLPNITVSMESRDNYAILKVTSLKQHGWGYDFNKEEIGYWRIMIHQQEEMGLFESYNINTPPMVDISTGRLRKVKKIKLSPIVRLTIPTSRHLCEEDPHYSRQQCLLQCSWQAKLEKIMELVKNISCIPFGFYLPKESKWHGLPVCRHATIQDSPDGSPGYFEYGSGDYSVLNYSMTLQGAEPRCFTECPSRCQTINFDPVEELVLQSDNELNVVMGYDFKFYFGSNEIQVIQDSISYTGDNLFAELSGITGSLLGMSFVGLADIIRMIILKFMNKK